MLIIVGPTAVGKNTLIDAICQRTIDLVRMPSATTRAPREGEIDGVSKVFLTDKQFDEYIQKKQFVEWQIIHGKKYGVLKKVVEERINAGQDYIADVEVLGAMKLKETFKENAVAIFIIPPTLKTLENRINSRDSENEENKQLRINRARAELAYISLCDQVVVNDDLNQAIADLKIVVDAERQGEKLPNQTKIMADVLCLNPEKTKALVLENDQLPEVLVKAGQFPHQAIEDYLNQEGYKKVNFLDDTQFKNKQNIGLDIPVPLDVQFQTEGKPVQVKITYLIETADMGQEINWKDLDEALLEHLNSKRMKKRIKDFI